MDFGFTAEEEAFRQELRYFLSKELPSGWKSKDWPGDYSVTLWETDWEFWREFFKKLGAKGWLTPSWPKEYGGQGRSLIEEMILHEEMALHGVPLFYSAVRIVGPSILRFGNEGQKREYLPGIGRGEVIICLGYSEPEVGSDLASVQTQAMRSGEGYVINGQKCFISFAHRADYCWLVARTDPKVSKYKGLSLFVVDLKTPGITIQSVKNMLGFSSLCNIFFDNVRVSGRNLVGGENQGWEVLTTALDLERLTQAARTQGAMRLLQYLLEYVKETQRDGEALAKDALVRSKLAQLAIEIEVSRLLAYRVAWLLSKGIVPDSESSISKVFNDELAQRLSNVGTQILGLYGQLKEGSKWAPLKGIIEHGYLSTVCATIGGGTSEIQRNIIAIRGLELPR